MRRIARLLALFLGLAAPSQALSGPSALRTLLTGDDGRGWEAVGRLNIGTRGFCTGALIAENVVLTAGHCLYDKHTGAPIDASEIEFLAGWRGGRASAYRSVRRAVVHPEYSFSSSDVKSRVRYDLAVLELDPPVFDAGTTA
jgi:V8-like Glu-specific endopeptidase